MTRDATSSERGRGQAGAFKRSVPLRIAEQGSFYVPVALGDVNGGMFVQYQVPAVQSAPFPIVMIHGGGMTGMTFLGTPDRRQSWSEYFLATGFSVYVVDQLGHGRSRMEGRFSTGVYRDQDTVVATHTAPESSRLWPTAHKHDQWPGSGRPGDRSFDSYFASLEEVVEDIAGIEAGMREAVVTLLREIGPAVLLGHSQGGRIAFAIGDSAPDLVRAILAVEPNGPPVYDLLTIGAPDYFEDGRLRRPWALTCTPLAYDPPAAHASELKFEKQRVADGDGLALGWLQTAPARRLVNLARIPMLIVTAEASNHSAYDHLTVAYLRQAGVDVEFLRLADAGITGNAHIMMAERNSLEIASVLEAWLSRSFG